jgi:hypothetical protein
MRPNTERAVRIRLSREPEWAATPVGQLARKMVDDGIPIRPIAQFLNVDSLVVRRWLLPVNGGPFGIGGSKVRRAVLHDRILLLCRVIDVAYDKRRLCEPWLANLRRTEVELYQPISTNSLKM